MYYTCYDLNNRLCVQDSLDEVESLLRKHNDFAKSFEAQEEKVHLLQDNADNLASADHYDTERCVLSMK